MSTSKLAPSFFVGHTVLLEKVLNTTSKATDSSLFRLHHLREVASYGTSNNAQIFEFVLGVVEVMCGV